MNKTRTYYQPFFDIDKINIPSELHSFQAFSTREKCEKWLKNNGYDHTKYSIVEMHDDDIEGVTILDEYGNIIEVNEDNDELTIVSSLRGDTSAKKKNLKFDKKCIK